MWTRPFLVVGGFLIALPQWSTSIIGVGLTAVVLAIIFMRKKAGAEEPLIGGQTAEVGLGNISDSS